MKANQKEPKLTYALDASGKMVHIGSVDRGLSCNCRCPKCNEPLIAKLGREGGRQAHFAHRKGSDCHGSFMTALHKLAEQIIEEEKAVMAPAYREIGRQRLSFVQVEVEQRVERKDLQPDLVGVTADGLRWIIEIRNTHEVDESKRDKLIESNITCLEIDVREQTLDNLESFILQSAESREWINNPNYDAQINEAKRKRVSKVENYLLGCPELTIPAYDKYDSRKITIKEAFVLSKTDDGLFSQVKVLSSDETPFVFNIGSRDDEHREHEADCNELDIITDSISLEEGVCPSHLDLSWSYHFVTEKERENRIKEYRNNPKYEVRPSCPCECSKPYNGKCIYKEEAITLKGICYYVCNKERQLRDENDHQPDHRKHNIEKSQIHSQEISTSEDLPFEKYWTIEGYYERLKSTNSYKTEKGYYAEIINCVKVCNKILLLYKDPIEASTDYPYHIDVISVDNGSLKGDKIDYTTLDSALYAFQANVLMCEQPDDNDLPF